MNPTSPKPDGSTIEEIDEFDSRVYRWKPPSAGPFRYVIAGFTSVWLCAWVAGFVGASNELLNGKPHGQHAFLAVWLVLWTGGGIFAITTLFLLLRPPKPESITLKRDTFMYDSGTMGPIMLMNPWFAMRNPNPMAPYHQMFKRRKRVEIAKSNLSKVVLERVGERQRLYFDHGADRIEIGEHLREPEPEWLADVIHAWLDR